MYDINNECSETYANYMNNQHEIQDNHIKWGGAKENSFNHPLENQINNKKETKCIQKKETLLTKLLHWKKILKNCVKPWLKPDKS